MAPQPFTELITPNEDQKTTLILIGVFILAILILWNVPILKTILYPFKLVTVALHEFGHAAAGCCTGAKIESIEVNPEEGGVTRMRGGSLCCTLPAGYLGSSFFGALMVFAGFNVLASKIVSVIIGVCLLVTLWWAKNWLTRGITLLKLLASNISFSLWVMSCLYSLWDIVEDLVVRKVNESDATKFAKYTGCCVPQFWGLVWFIISLIFLGAAIIAGLAVFHDQSA
ncbi:peptidase M50B-like-domain-containing protein [Syncephalis plumigaleata]|nr:peptidase M50B-like-domain-containing protein [Syncephalis plumigaleata]